MSNETNSHGSSLAYWVAGLGIGVVLSIFLAPRSGEENRKLFADKCLDAIDNANEKVRRSRKRVIDIVDRRQQQISDAVAASREAMRRPKAIAS
jgi:gas vesicle protein